MLHRKTDADWVRGVFGKSNPNYDAKLVMSSASELNNAYVGDTTVGGNVALNPLPQFTKFADLKSYGFLARPQVDEIQHESVMFDKESNGIFTMKSYTTGSYGMGRWYGQRIEQNRTRLYLQFGIQKFTGVLAFYLNCHSVDMTYLTRNGLWSQMMRGVGAAGALWASIAIFGGSIVLPIMAIGALVKTLSSMAPSQYFYVDPAMDLYLRAVQSMLDTQLVHSRLVPYKSVLHTASESVEDKSDSNYQTMQDMYKALPEVWKSNGKFDVFKMVNRYQVLADMQNRTMNQLLDIAGGDPERYNALLRSWIDDAKDTNQVKEYTDMNIKGPDGTPMSITDALLVYKARDAGYQLNTEELHNQAEAVDAVAQNLKDRHTQNQVEDEAVENGEGADANDPSYIKMSQTMADAQEEQKNTDFWKRNEDFQSSLGSIGNQVLAELHDGAQWICFNIDGTGSVSDSINNNTITPEISSAINGVSSASRKINFATAGQQTGIALIDGMTNSIKDIITGGISMLQLDGIAALFGASQIIIPETWEDSQTSFGSETYTIPLRSPYGNDISIFQNIIVPLCFILAGALPLATGKQTYQNPFFCKFISPGRSMSRCAMITSVNINRGVGNLKWRSDGKMLACDVTITIKDLNPTVATPILKHPGLFDSDNAYTDYMAIVGNANLNDLIYVSNRATLNFNQWLQSWKSTFSEGNVINSAMNTGVGRLMSNLFAGTSKFNVN